MTVYVYVFRAGALHADVIGEVTIGGKIATSPHPGTYTADLPVPGKYKIRIVAPGYYAFEGEREFSKYFEIADIEVQPLPTPVPVPGGEYSNYGRVGKHCWLGAKYVGGQQFWFGIHDTKGVVTQGFSTAVAGREAAEKVPECFVEPTTTDQGGILDAVGKKIQEISGFLAGLQGWLVDHVLDAIWAALTRERKGG